MTDNTKSNDRVILGLIFALVLYVAAAIAGSPQSATARIAAQQKAAAEAPPDSRLERRPPSHLMLKLARSARRCG